MVEDRKSDGAPAGTRPVTIQADPNVTPGVYANLAMITHRREEFVFDFLFVQPQSGSKGEAVALLRSRVVTTPEHTKRVLRALEENVRRYEAQFGPIREAQETPPLLQ
ncbi:MAG: DUF3467 domain-containing protein [Deltaproteobacteria bacterium]|nr:DUF3467 domain-containing protein [Deltaproteobacteria bacterium]